jgi:hypothetical protein
MKKRSFKFGGNVNEIVPASRQNIDQRTPSGVRPVSSPVIPVKSDVQGAMKHGGESKMSRSVKRMAVGGVPGPMNKGRSGGPGEGSKGPAPGGSRGQGNKGPAPGQGQGKSGAPGGNPNMGGDQGKGPAPGMRYPMGDGGGGNMGRMDPRMRNLMMQRGMGRGGPELDIGEGKGPVPGRGRGLPNAMMGMDQMGVAPRAPGMKKGGKVFASSYRDMTGGAAGGIGRLEKSSIAAKTKSQKLKKGGKVRGYADGGELSLGDRLALERAGFDPETRMKRSGSSYGKAPYEVAELPAPKKKTSAPKSYGDSERGNGPGPNVSRTAKKTESDNNAIRSQSTQSISKMIEVARNNGNQREVDRLTKLNPDAAAMVKPRAAAPSPAPEPRPRPKAADKPSSAEGMVGRGRSDQRISTDRENVRLGGAQSVAIDRMLDLARRNGNQKEIDRLTALKAAKGLKKGGRVEAFEGTAKDMAQDKKLAKKRGMSLKAWEKSSADEKHDKQRNMKGLKKGGVTCGGMAMGGYASGGMSTAQDGMKGALRPKPSAMAKGGKVKRMAGGGNSTEGFSYPYDDQAERQIGRENSRKSGTVRQLLDNLDRSVGLLPKEPNYKRDEMGNPFRDRQDPKSSLSAPSRKQSAGTMAEKKSLRETGSKNYKEGTSQRGLYPRGKKAGYVEGAGLPYYSADKRTKEPVNEIGMKKGGKVGMTFGKPLPGTKVSSQKIRSTVSTDGANMKKDGMKGQLRAKASGAKGTAMMKPLGMTKMAKGGKVRGAGCAQRGTKFIGEV